MYRPSEEREATYEFEHWLAWLMAVGAIVLAVIGSLVAFGVLNIRTLEIADDPLAAPGDTVLNFRDGLLFLLPAIAVAFLALTLHMTEHHNRAMASREVGLYNLEHLGAYLMAGLTLLFGVLTLLIGFDVFDRGNQVYDGYVWGLLAIGGGVLTTTLHAVGHHQMAADEEYITRIIEQRVGPTARMASPVREPGAEGRGT